LPEALGVSQSTAWRMGHALRLLMARDHPLGGTVEIDEFHFGAKPQRDADRPRLGRGRKGQPRTDKTPALAIVQRPASLETETPAGEARTVVVADLSWAEAEHVLEAAVDPTAHLMSDEKTFVSVGTAFGAHDTVRHSQREYVRGEAHANSAGGFNDRVRRTIAGVFHHISPEHADFYFDEAGFRWAQGTVAGTAQRRTRKGRTVLRTLSARIWTRTTVSGCPARSATPEMPPSPRPMGRRSGSPNLRSIAARRVDSSPAPRFHARGAYRERRCRQLDPPPIHSAICRRSIVSMAAVRTATEVSKSISRY
jgi:hypothetical protein